MRNFKSKEVDNIEKTKEILNCILENGAYSDSNYNHQMSKKGKNYNEFEKKLVTLAYRFKKFQGEKLQKQLFNFITSNCEFIEYLKMNDSDLFSELEELREYGSRL